MFKKVLLGSFAASYLYDQEFRKPKCCGIFGVVSNTPNVESKPNPITKKTTTMNV